MIWPRATGQGLHLGQTGPLDLLPFRLGRDELGAHKHVIGLTGQGKSKLLASIFVQLHLRGIACALIDPHADLALDVLGQLADRGWFRRPDAYTRLCYVDFGRRDRFLPFNVLRQPYPDHQVADAVCEVCTRVWPALADGVAPTFENILRHGVVVLLRNGLPLTGLARVLTDKPYRDGLLRRVDDPQIVRFFRDRYDRWGREAPLMRESTLNRVDLLTFSPALRYSLGQEDNAPDFRRLMDEGVSLVVNLGGLAEQEQRFLGALICHGFEVAALSRADTPEEERRHYELIMDEFSMFSSQSEEGLARILSLARKYRLFLTMAHQTFSQLNARLQGALQNTVAVAFRLGRTDAEWAARRFGRIVETEVKHEVPDPLAQERTHPVYSGLAEQWERWTKALEELAPRQAYVRIGRRTAKIRTLHVPRPRLARAELRAIADGYAERLMAPAVDVVPTVDAPVVSQALGGTPPPEGATLLRRVRVA